VIDNYRAAKDKRAAFDRVKQFNQELRESQAAKLIQIVNADTLHRAMRNKQNKRRQAFMEDN